MFRNVFLTFFIIIFIMGSLVFQNSLNIYSFLLCFYLIPSFLYSVVVARHMKGCVAEDVVPLVFSGVVFTFFYTGVYYLKIINFEHLISKIAEVQTINIELSMSLSTIINTFLMNIALTVLIYIMFKKIKGGVKYV